MVGIVENVKNQFKNLTWQLNIVKRKQKVNTFKLLPMRWIVERNFAWLDNCRRLSKDYERLTASTEAFIYLAQIRRVAIIYKKV